MGNRARGRENGERVYGMDNVKGDNEKGEWENEEWRRGKNEEWEYGMWKGEWERGMEN